MCPLTTRLTFNREEHRTIMQVNHTQGNIVEQAVDCIVVNLFEGVTAPGGATGAVDRALNGAITNLIASGDFSGKLGSTALIYTLGKLPASRVLIAGLGKQDKCGLRAWRSSQAAATKSLAQLEGVKSFATVVHGAGIGGLCTQQAAQAGSEATLMSAY